MDVKTLDQRLEGLKGPPFYITAILFFEGFAVLLASIDMDRFADYAITQRT